ncbi:MAG: hypothetical protein LBU87_02510 [Lactobacillales bacterium]|jgi:hypothetical protein|nr:hypothetical protein [Lactobacillales bacterium]
MTTHALELIEKRISGQKLTPGEETYLNKRPAEVIVREHLNNCGYFVCKHPKPATTQQSVSHENGND